ncbi:hypothetical protein ACFUKV_31170 [Streptomyces paradoxus]|uniref:hypothetical protein n=1 Tax=Streptomyces paradoxus TaxID=66375 RepID=UPI003634F254
MQWRKSSRHVGASENDNAVVVKTTRYLRLLMVTLVVGLTVSILYEHSKSQVQGGSGQCWQSSISAYYYTPVQLFFVGALVAIGISLIALKGSTEFEDIFLNCAGILAPVVALVPTPNVGQCGSVLTDTTNRQANVSNNVTALLFMAAVTFVVLIGLKWAKRPVTGVPGPAAHADEASARLIAGIGFVAALVLYVAAGLLFIFGREWFNSKAHWTAAVTMFVFIFLAVVNNAVNLFLTQENRRATQRGTGGTGEVRRAWRSVFNRYMWIAILMVAFTAFFWFSPMFDDHRVFLIEASLIMLFAVFWVIQTKELWNHGLRPADTEARGALQMPQEATDGVGGVSSFSRTPTDAPGPRSDNS